MRLASVLQKLQGHDVNVTLTFAQGFDGNTAKIGDFTIEVTEASIAAATNLPRTGERWFKNKPSMGHQLQRFPCTRTQRTKLV